ncbi:MAG: elongation factor G [Candidatus Hatepunaea meridiana]|nr:elongation factor G [Candidatus Hatepunaea meridiana]
MKEAHPDKIRNVALISHQSAGKTTLTESLLHQMGVITRMGSIEEGNTASDYQSEEISRQMSISTILVVGKHKDIKVNLLDTPGFTDFSGEVKSAIRVADITGVLIHAAAGIEVGTDMFWRFAEERSLPRFFFINHCDRENVDFDQVVQSLADAYSGAVPIQFPVNVGDGFNQIIDLISMKLITWNPDGGIKSTADIPGEHKDKADEMRQNLIESVAETDDELMEKFFENDGLTQEELLIGLKKGFQKGAIYPVLCGAAKQEVGTSLLLDFLTDIATSPVDMPTAIASKENVEKELEIPCDPTAATASLVFKTISDKHVGDLAFFRVYQGTVSSGDDLRNTTRMKAEKIGQIYTISGKNRTSVDTVPAGDMGALVKLKDTHTGDTLSNPKERYLLEGVDFPDPVITIAMEPREKGDDEKIGNALHVLVEENPSYHFKYDPELRQLLVSGQGELHLDVLIDRMKERFSVEINQVEPRIPYRETIRTSAEGQGKYKKQSGGRGQYGDCWIRLEPLPRGDEFEFVDAIVGGVIPSKFIPAVEKGVRGTMGDGVIAGYKVVDVKVTCYDGSYHTVDSSENAFKVAGSLGFKKVFREAKPVMLEPINDVEVRVPEEFMGDVMGDISSRRGKILGMDAEGRFQVIRAKVPLAELYKYTSTLRSLTGGRGLYKSSFSHYEQVPGDIQVKLVTEYEERRAEGN